MTDENLSISVIFIFKHFNKNYRAVAQIFKLCFK